MRYRAPTGERAKAYGAFYTDEGVASFLVRWAVRTPGDRVLDPSFGGGVFLGAATRRLADLGGDPNRIFGVELDAEVHGRVSQELAGFRIRAENLIRSDFFELGPSRLPPFDAVVGNPPFIRYQRFNGDARARAILRAQEQGVAIGKSASSWAAFLVHSASFLKPGGRLGMVVPAELGHAAYARPLLSHLAETFGRVTLLTFRERLFPDLSQDTLLLLAENRGAAFVGFFWRDLEGPGALVQNPSFTDDATERLDEEALLNGQEKLVTRALPRAARDLYGSLSEHPGCSRLGALADVGIGYVTGANGFFHLSPREANALGIPETFLKRAVFRGSALTGLTFDEADWQRAALTGTSGYLLSVRTDALPAPLRAYIENGETLGVHEAYKCRIRSPWYRVPHVYEPDAFLTYMSGLRPQLVANQAGAFAPNTLHLVRLHPHVEVSAETLAASWQTSLTSLSAELEGHALGGGMLKLEPSEARRVLLALPRRGCDLARELDTLVRRGDRVKARRLADGAILQEGLGLSRQDCELLRASATSLRQRRCRRRAPGPAGV